MSGYKALQTFFNSEKTLKKISSLKDHKIKSFLPLTLQNKRGKLPLSGSHWSSVSTKHDHYQGWRHE